MSQAQGWAGNQASWVTAQVSFYCLAQPALYPRSHPAKNPADLLQAPESHTGGYPQASVLPCMSETASITLFV